MENNILTPVGYKHEEEKPEDYKFGSRNTKLPKTIIRPDGDWRGVGNLLELQAPNFETYTCVSESLTKSEAKQAKLLWNEDENWSARLLASNAGTDESGASPQAVSEARRKKGGIMEELYATVDATSFEDFYKTIPEDIAREALELRPIRKFLHEYVPTEPQAIFDALKMGVPSVAVYGWAKDGEYYYKPDGTMATHLTSLVYAKWGEYWEVEDTYKPFYKKLVWNYDFAVCKRYWIGKKEAKVYSNNWLIDLFKAFKRGR